jgi:MshEN domain
MRVELTDAGDYPAFRDYFLRLGGSVVSDDSLTVDVTFPEGLLDEDESPQMYYRTWARANRLHARAVEDGRGQTAVEEAAPLTLVAPPPDSDARPPMRLGELLVRKGLITDDQLSEALVESRRSGNVVGRVLVDKGWVFESELARVLAEQWSIPYVNLALVGVDHSARVLMSPEVGRRCAAVPVRFLGHEVRVAFADPSDPDVVAEVQSHIAAPIQPAIAELSDIDAIWRSVRY